MSGQSGMQTGKQSAGGLDDLRLPAIDRRVRLGRRLALARACDARAGLKVHDALAGWGTDGLVLAGLGCTVHMSELNPHVHRILEARLAEQGPDHGVACELEDARERWRAGDRFDVVFLDPMFAPHPKTALPARHMQVLLELAGRIDDADVAALIDEARRVASSRVVVKRRAGATAYGNPSWRISGRSVRFDVYRPSADGS